MGAWTAQVLALGLSSTGCGPGDIDRVFDTYDKDNGGWMDADEASDMVRGLQSVAEEAEGKRRAKERVARGMRLKVCALPSSPPRALPFSPPRAAHALPGVEEGAASPGARR